MNRNKNLGIIILFLIVSFLCMLFLTTSSPIYTVNPSPDGNSMLTIGKGLWHGMMPYKELLDQRGPLIYLINSFATLISYKSFLGIYIIESIAMFLDLLFLCKIVNLKYSRKISIVVSLLVIPFIFNSIIFTYGDLPEEFVLPLIIMMIFEVEKHGYSNLNNFVLLLQGVFVGIAFWIKYTLIVPWIILFMFIAITCIINKKYGKFFKSILYGLIGFLIVTVPLLLFYLLKKSINSLFYTYFYLNITGYNSSQSLFIGKTFLVVIALGTILIYLYYRYIDDYRLNKLLLLTMFYVNILVLAYASHGFKYYYFVENFIFIILALLFADWLSKHKISNLVFYLIPVLAVLLIFVTNTNFKKYTTYFGISSEIDLSHKDAVPYQKEFSNIINKSKDKSILNYKSLDLGIYTYSGRIPSSKYFMVNNMSYKSALKSQTNDLLSDKYHFVIVRYLIFPKIIVNYNLTKKERENLVFNYKVADSRKILFEGHFEQIVLYKNKKENA